MNSIQAYQTKAVERTTLMHQLDCLHKELDGLEAMAAKLNDNLSPLLQSFPVPAANGDKAAPSNDCAVVNRLGGLISRVSTVAAHLETIGNSLQL